MCRFASPSSQTGTEMSVGTLDLTAPSVAPALQCLQGHLRKFKELLDRESLVASQKHWLRLQAKCDGFNTAAACSGAISQAASATDDTEVKRSTGGKRKRCEHGELQSCRICSGCPHGKVKQNCKQCSPCPHGKIVRSCVQCYGCPHGKLKQNCRQCNACPHGKEKRYCLQCKACQHGKLKRDCLKCDPCPHGNVKRRCMQCCGCVHGNRKYACSQCNACPHGRLKRNCHQCRAQLEKRFQMLDRLGDVS